jgi:hypothetical protein
MQSTAAPLGPLLELRAAEKGAPFNRQVAEETLRYWRVRTGELLANITDDHAEVRSAWVTMLRAHARLFTSRNCPLEAQEMSRMANELAP